MFDPCFVTMSQIAPCNMPLKSDSIGLPHFLRVHRLIFRQSIVLKIFLETIFLEIVILR